MDDLLFDIIAREIVMDANDFSTTSNPSVQNAGIIAYSRGANPLLPMMGIGLTPQVVNGSVKEFVFELNRWQAQTLGDGATLAKWSITPSVSSAATLMEASYL